MRPSYAELEATVERLTRERDEARAAREHAVAHAVKLEESPLRFANIKLEAERDALAARLGEARTLVAEIACARCGFQLTNEDGEPEINCPTCGPFRAAFLAGRGTGP